MINLLTDICKADALLVVATLYAGVENWGTVANPGATLKEFYFAISTDESFQEKQSERIWFKN